MEQCAFFSLLYFCSVHFIDYPQNELTTALNELKLLEATHTSQVPHTLRPILLFLMGLVPFDLAEFDSVVDYYKNYSSL